MGKNNVVFSSIYLSWIEKMICMYIYIGPRRDLYFFEIYLFCSYRCVIYVYVSSLILSSENIYAMHTTPTHNKIGQTTSRTTPTSNKNASTTTNTTLEKTKQTHLYTIKANLKATTQKKSLFTKYKQKLLFLRNTNKNIF